MNELQVLVGAEVNYVRFSHQVDINFTYGNNQFANLQIEASFELQTKQGTVAIDPATPKTFAPVIEVLHAKVTHMDLSEDYNLTISFDNEYQLHVSPIPTYEAWNLTGDALPYYVASPLPSSD